MVPSDRALALQRLLANQGRHNTIQRVGARVIGYRPPAGRGMFDREPEQPGFRTPVQVSRQQTGGSSAPLRHMLPNLLQCGLLDEDTERAGFFGARSHRCPPQCELGRETAWPRRRVEVDSVGPNGPRHPLRCVQILAHGRSHPEMFFRASELPVGCPVRMTRSRAQRRIG